jgi:peptide/nickel transport system substrate-binding protein
MITILQPRLPLRDPHDCTDGADELCLYGAFYDTLMRREGTGFVPRLAERWEVSDDARHWRFICAMACGSMMAPPAMPPQSASRWRRMARPDKGYTLGAPGVWSQYLGDAQITALRCPLTVEGCPRPTRWPTCLMCWCRAIIVAPSA